MSVFHTKWFIEEKFCIKIENQDQDDESLFQTQSKISLYWSKIILLSEL